MLFLRKFWIGYVLLVCVSLLLFACGEDEFDNRTLFLLEVTDANGELVPTAKVKVYTHELDFRRDENVIFEGTTDEKGRMQLALEPIYEGFYISVQKGFDNNWRSQNYLRAGEPGAWLNKKIRIQSSPETIIAGRYKRRWNNYRYTFNGTEYRGCAHNKDWEFTENGLIQIYFPDNTECTNPGAVSGNDRWLLEEGGEVMFTGGMNNPFIYNIVEVEPYHMHLRFEAQGVVIERFFVPVDD